MNFANLVNKWEAEAAAMERRGILIRGEVLCREFVADLQALQRGESEEPLTIAQASAESGYSAEHVARMVRQGLIPNQGRKRAPRIRRADLPRKPGGRVAAGPLKAYDPVTDARQLLSRHRGARDE